MQTTAMPQNIFTFVYNLWLYICYIKLILLFPILQVWEQADPLLDPLVRGSKSYLL